MFETRNSATAQETRDALCQLKSCQLLNNSTVRKRAIFLDVWQLQWSQREHM